VRLNCADFVAERLVELGMTAGEAGAKRDLATGACSIVPNPTFALFVPGRIEILGKHTDYAGGRSIIGAAEKGIIVIARQRDDSLVNVTRTDPRECAGLALSPDLQPIEGHWSNYSATVLRRVARNFPGELKGLDLAIASDLPQAAGLSSSSAIVVAIFLAVARANELRSREEYQSNIHNHEDLAGYLGTVENGQSFGPLVGDKGVGTFGGSQDHTAILCARHNCLSTYSYAPVRSEGVTPFPASQSLVIGVSGVVAEKTRAARDLYNRVSLRVIRRLPRRFIVPLEPLINFAASSASSSRAVIPRRNCSTGWINLSKTATRLSRRLSPRCAMKTFRASASFPIARSTWPKPSCSIRRRRRRIFARRRDRSAQQPPVPSAPALVAASGR